MLGRICAVQAQPRKYVLDRLDHTTPRTCAVSIVSPPQPMASIPESPISLALSVMDSMSSSSICLDIKVGVQQTGEARATTEVTFFGGNVGQRFSD